MSRHKCLVKCLSSVATSFSCRDLMSSSSSIPGCLTLSSFHAQLVLSSITLHLRLELYNCNPNMHFDCCKSFTTSNSLILLRFFCCNFLQPIISILLGHILLLFTTIFAFFLISCCTADWVKLFHIPAYKSVFLYKNQSEKWTENR